MKILFCGDVVGRSGREKVLSALPKLRKELALDCVIVNVDNAAGGFGVTPDICREFLAAGADALTGGDHVWDQRAIVPYISQEKKLLRPANYPLDTPGAGAVQLELNGKKVLVLHLLGQVFLRDNLDCPFRAVEKLLEGQKLGANQHAIIVDFHAEATSEKTAMGKMLDGRVSLVVGSHTHIPTADQRILPKGTAYQTDAGMCGDYDSVIGFEASTPISMFLGKMRKNKMVPAEGEATLRGLLVETNDATGLAEKVELISR